MEMTKYCDVDMAKRFARLISFKDLGLEDDDEYTDHVDELIKVASARIDRYCKRPSGFFDAGGASVTEYHDGKSARDETRFYPLNERKDAYDEWRYTYWTKQTPIISITSIHKRTSAIGVTEAWSEITAYNYIADTGQIRLKSSVAPSEGMKRLRIIYAAGYASRPDDIELACAMLVSHYLQGFVQQDLTQRVQWSRPTIPDFARPQVFTEDIKALLEPFKKKRTHAGGYIP